MQQKTNKAGRNSTDEDEKTSASAGRNGKIIHYFCSNGQISLLILDRSNYVFFLYLSDEILGLRILSKKVREIVCDLKETTYKQVAESLIKDMESKKHSGSVEFVSYIHIFFLPSLC